jgi:hypothetical protein
MNDETSRAELQRRLSRLLTNGHSTGFDMSNLREVLQNAEDAARQRTWTEEEWSELAEAIERVAHTPTAASRIEDGALLVTQADGQPITQQYQEDARLIVASGQRIVAEMERLRTLVEASMLTLRADEQHVAELVAAGLTVLVERDCGDDPEAGLDDVCAICRLRTALRRMQARRGNGGRP